MKIQIAENLKQLMRIEHLSQSKLATKIGIDQRTISKWINGKSEPSIEYLWILADYFDVSIDYIAGRKEI
ncbi:MAG: helix-turn-helix domain-containing protein [Clostridia bacterium]|nr:helix-turn-helix domain-containing protein [Clostridia bacterium]